VAIAFSHIWAPIRIVSFHRCHSSGKHHFTDLLVSSCRCNGLGRSPTCAKDVSAPLKYKFYLSNGKKPAHNGLKSEQPRQSKFRVRWNTQHPPGFNIVTNCPAGPGTQNFNHFPVQCVSKIINGRQKNHRTKPSHGHRAGYSPRLYYYDHVDVSSRLLYYRSKLIAKTLKVGQRNRSTYRGALRCTPGAVITRQWFQSTQARSPRKGPNTRHQFANDMVR